MAEQERRRRLLRELPRVDRLLEEPVLRDSGLAPPLAKQGVRAALDHLREEIRTGARREVPPPREIAAAALALARGNAAPALRGVYNGTGVVLHTGLGRAALSQRAAERVSEVARGYSSLELDLDTGKRGSRSRRAEAQLCALTGAEAAAVVNNNAGGVLLALAALAAGGEVLVSRGELVEIGGGFRVPEVLEQSGCRLREVGTTNRTRAADYAAALGPETRAILKVHPSNYRIVGFTAQASLSELAALARQAGLPLIADLGSGNLADVSEKGVRGEPQVLRSLAGGADVACFSGDKLLGGPQAGLILGRRVFLAPICRHPLFRALRADKLTLAALEATLESYQEGTQWEELPVLHMLALPQEELRARAERLCALLRERGVPAEAVATESRLGGGSAPGTVLPSWAAALSPPGLGPLELERRLRQGLPPVVGRVHRDRLLLDLRTLPEGELETVADVAAAAIP